MEVFDCDMKEGVAEFFKESSSVNILFYTKKQSEDRPTCLDPSVKVSSAPN